MERNGVTRTVDELLEELRVTDELLKARQGVLDAIPACPVHGAGCVPHALEWVQQAREFIDSAKMSIARGRRLRRRSS